jgi:hypothetical protein
MKPRRGMDAPDSQQEQAMVETAGLVDGRGWLAIRRSGQRVKPEIKRVTPFFLGGVSFTPNRSGEGGGRGLLAKRPLCDGQPRRKS